MGTLKLINILIIYLFLLGGGSRAAATSKMERFIIKSQQYVRMGKITF